MGLARQLAQSGLCVVQRITLGAEGGIAQAGATVFAWRAVKAVIAPRTEEPSTPKPAKKDLVRESLAQLREALKAGKPADELEPLLDALVQSLGL